MRRYSKIAVKADETPESLREEFPDALVKAFVDCKNSDFVGAEYDKYVRLATKFLDDKAGDKIEYCKLVVRLTRATYDLVDMKHVKKEAKEAAIEAKEDARLGRDKRTL
jgi:hypothetical protein